VTGPLTQRLVSALMEENLISESALNTDSSNSGSENISNNLNGNRGGAISLLKNGISIERRVRKELIEQGILEAEDFGKVSL
jgi:transcriptional adapter 3